MHFFTERRTDATPDEIWLVQHPSVFTQGQAGKAEHILSPGNIPVIQSDRGGQVTYHGPGQQIMYVLINLKRRKIGIRELVTHLENCVISTLKTYDIHAQARADAPGVYVEGKKICSLGLRIRKGCTLHGLALNINMDMRPFECINPCGYAGMQMAQVSHFVPDINQEQITSRMTQEFTRLLGYPSTLTSPWNLYDYE